MKQLILAEKPSVGRDIVNAIGGHFEKRDGYYENSQYIISWAIGHLVELCEPEDYQPNLKKWTLSALPIIPECFKLKPNPKTIKQYKVVKQLLNRPDVELIAGTDAGREGELILRYIMRLSGYSRPFKRLWLSETTPESIRKGLANPLPGQAKDLLAAAAECRSHADWLIGINATRAFTKKHGDLFSIGRVQTPTLGLIVAREKEIKTFIPAHYWELYADFVTTDGQVYRGKWFKNKNKNRFNQEADGISIKNKIVGQDGSVIKVEEKAVSEPPPTLFNLNDLQKEANKKFGFTASQTLEIAQALYEKHKLLSYPRTEFKHLTNELAKTIPSRLSALGSVSGYSKFVAYAQSAPKPGKRFIDDAKVGDHHALIPTNVKPTAALSPNEAKIYNMVARRFLAMFFPAAEYKQTKIMTSVSDETFLTSGKIELSPGWKEVIPPLKGENKEKSDEEVLLPPLTKGENVAVTKAKLQQKKTEPPKRYTEGTLLAVMEGAGKFVDDKALKDAMKGHGLGTSATRAAIIERLIKVGYVERKSKTLIPTQKGETLISLVPEVVSSPQMTGEWEKALADIEAGQVNPKRFMSEIISLTKKIVNLAKEQKTNGYMPESTKEVVGKCPLCGREVVEYAKKFGCGGFREGCAFSFGKQILKKKITVKQAKQLLTNGKVLIKGFTSSKTGKKFDAALVLKDGKVSFDFS
ncbi:DNA topoisomerase III [Desulforamulus reducens MI-1]|uniref:DNA topoisomerase n=1 Tax=Desulforamulus reducens (strain ATCC BAA-1160 / DSM 100696 / MI-1) TaxID=349161 RepID=A4J5M4_DESRM|nr:DNA topoisomerase III [Desulforamulus reducens]ABO50377.1 DNA topoisomerase III [Desulforamulus reducens MI-1]